jgi:hypothetical protein
MIARANRKAEKPVRATFQVGLAENLPFLIGGSMSCLAP